MSHSLYESAQPIGQPILRYTSPHGPKSSYEPGHTLRRWSYSTGQVDSRVRASYRVGRSMGMSVPIKSLDFLKSNHVASHGSYMTLNAHHGLQCSITAISIATPCNLTLPITLINETFGLLYSISTQRDTTMEGDLETHNQTFTCNSWTTLDPLHLVLVQSAPT